jgi:cytochrome oxidase Cu insertion factor (SCO1/SenC/PrrC family)
MTTTPDVPPALVRRRRLQLALLALVFFGPLALSFWLYYGGTRFQPQRRVNHGELIDPARPLPAVALATPAGGTTGPRFLRGKWSLVYVAGRGCDDRCRQSLAELRTVRLALERDMPRVQRVLLGAPGCCGRAELGVADPDLVTAWLDGADGARLLATFPDYGAPIPNAGRVYLVDPLGNLLMSYPSSRDQKGILKDLEKLLRLSHIG